MMLNRVSLKLLTDSLSFYTFKEKGILEEEWLVSIPICSSYEVQRLCALHVQITKMLQPLVGRNLWAIYFTVYSLLTSAATNTARSFKVSFINLAIMINGKATMEFILFTILLSLGGLPLFIGFLPKWAIIKTIIVNNLRFITTAMVVISLATLYCHLLVHYSSSVIHNFLRKIKTVISLRNRKICNRASIKSFMSYTSWSRNRHTISGLSSYGLLSVDRFA
jgi:hypothetical protein